MEKFTIKNFIECSIFPLALTVSPWELCNQAPKIIADMIAQLPAEYEIRNGVAIHKSATVENNVILKAPCIINAECFIAANAYLRGGVWLGAKVIIGPSTEIKSSYIFPNSKIAHFNFVGDSVIGNNVNIEAGAIVANYRNDSEDKRIYCKVNAESIDTKVTKFGALIGDDCKIGANAVLSPGTILTAKTIVKRLALIDQMAKCI